MEFFIQSDSLMGNMSFELFLEIVILILAAWALWKSLPRPLNYDWVSIHAKFLLALSGEKNEKWSQIASREELEKPFSILDWDDIQLDSEKVIAFVRRKCKHLLLIGEGEVAKELSTLLDRPLSSLSTVEDLSERLQKANQRFLFMATGEKGQEVLQFLHQYPAVRDHMAGVLLIDPILDQEWCKKHFNHLDMDVEAQFSIPYFVFGRKEYETLEKPPVDERGWKAIELIDLGVFSEKLQEKWMTGSIALVLCKTMEVA